MYEELQTHARKHVQNDSFLCPVNWALFSYDNVMMGDQFDRIISAGAKVDHIATYNHHHLLLLDQMKRLCLVRVIY